jgi:transcriptional regulator with XRE-family HTH domain
MQRKNSSGWSNSVDSQNGAESIATNLLGMSPNTQPSEFRRPFPDNYEIGRRIRRARKARGWTIAEMAQVGQIKAVVLGSYERGSRNMPLSRLGEIAAILNVEPAELLDFAQPSQSAISALTIDLRALSRPAFSNPERLVMLVNFCGGIVKMRNDWNGEVLSLRLEDLRNLSFTLGTSQIVLTNWLIDEQYLFRAIQN